MRRTRLVVALAAATAFLASSFVVRSSTTESALRVTPAAAVSAGAAPRIGASVGIADGQLLWVSDADLTKALDDVVAMGGSWIRVDFPWSVVQHRGPDAWDWAPIDRVVRAANARGIKVLALLGHAPTWARAPRSAPFDAPLNLDGFVRFAEMAAARYAPLGVRHWEVWNEPNIKVFWGSAPSSRDYAEMLIRTSAALKAVDANAFVVSAGLAPATDIPNETIPPLYFLAGLYVYGAGDSFDAVGIHPYSFPKRPTTAETWNTFWQQRYSYIVMGWFGDEDKQIWATEFGAPTGRSRSSISEGEQAAHIAEGIRAWRRYSFAGPMFLYTWRDLSNDKTSYSQNMGLRRVDGSAKPVVGTLTALLRLRR